MSCRRANKSLRCFVICMHVYLQVCVNPACVEGVLPGVCQPVGCLCTTLCSVCVCVCVCFPPKVRNEVIIRQPYSGLNHKQLHFHIDFLSLQMENHTVRQIGNTRPLAPPALTHAHTTLPQLTNDSRVNGSKVQTVFLSGH